jgi:hypothetical protein
MSLTNWRVALNVVREKDVARRCYAWGCCSPTDTMQVACTLLTYHYVSSHFKSALACYIKLTFMISCLGVALRAANTVRVTTKSGLALISKHALLLPEVMLVKHSMPLAILGVARLLEPLCKNHLFFQGLIVVLSLSLALRNFFLCHISMIQVEHHQIRVYWLPIIEVLLVLKHPFKHLLVVLLLRVELLEFKHCFSIASVLPALDFDIKEVFKYLTVQMSCVWRLLIHPLQI